jgi:hypothetical protein
MDCIKKEAVQAGIEGTGFQQARKKIDLSGSELNVFGNVL